MGISQKTKEKIADNLFEAILHEARFQSPSNATHWRFYADSLRGDNGGIRLDISIEYTSDPLRCVDEVWIAL